MEGIINDNEVFNAQGLTSLLSYYTTQSLILIAADL